MKSREKLSELFHRIFTLIWRRPQDAFSFSFLHICILLCYFIGITHVAPVVFAELADWQLLLLHVYGAWVFVAILSNIHLIRKRDSSIRNKLLPQPNIRPPPPEIDLSAEASCTADAGEGDRLLTERTKYIGQQFMARPFGEDAPWHICAECEIFVPPRAWHCSDCKTCILRRDHHCVFTMVCIGEENQANFLSLVLYLALGTTTCSIIHLIHQVYFLDIALWWCIFKMLVPLYHIVYEFSILNMLAGTCFMGQFPAWAVFAFYLQLASKGMTSADKHRGVIRNGGVRSYESLTKMLGPNPFFRILYPFHKPQKVTFGIPPESSEVHELKCL